MGEPAVTPAENMASRNINGIKVGYSENKNLIGENIFYIYPGFSFKSDPPTLTHIKVSEITTVCGTQ